MSVESIRYRIPPGQEAAFEAAYGDAQRHLAASPVCRRYELLRCEEEMQHYAPTGIAGVGVAAHEVAGAVT